MSSNSSKAIDVTAGASAHVKSLVWLGVRVVALLAIYTAIDEILRFITLLPEESYRAPVIGVELILHVLSGSWIWELAAESLHGKRRILLQCIAGLLGVAMLVRYPRCWHNYKRVVCSWQSLSGGKPLRWLMAVPALLAAWMASTYDYNLFFDQPHYADRLLLLLLAGLFVWRPVFVFPFLLLLLAVFSQFSYPYPHNPSWPELNLLVRVLMLLGAALIIHVITGREDSTDLVLVVFCLIAAQYWGSGIGKYRLNWISHPHLHLLIFGAYANGWLASWEPETIVRISQTCAITTIPLMVFTLFVEWGSVLTLCRRSFTFVFLASFIVFHLGVFGMTGMFFWKWMVLELACAAFVVYAVPKGDRLFSMPYVVLSMAIIAASPVIFKPKNLSWYDTPVTYYRSFEATGESGSKYRLSPHTFTPYSDQATLGAFSCYSKAPQLTTIWGITSDRALADALVSVTTPEQVFDLEQERGMVLYDAEQCEHFDDFLRRFLGTLNRRRSKKTLLSPLQPPAHLWTLARSDDYRIQERIVNVQIFEETFLYDGHQFAKIRRRRLHELEISHDSE